MITLVNFRNRQSRYAEEILTHAGMPFNHADSGAEWSSLLLVTAARSLDAEQRARISESVRGGSALITVGGCSGFEELLGASDSQPLDETWVTDPDREHGITAEAHGKLHVFGGRALTATTGRSIARLTSGGDALVINQVGNGVAVGIGPDIIWSVEHIQFGVPVAKDADPAPDGTAALNDDILKAEDGHVLDWEHDRQQTLTEGPVESGVLGIDPAYPDGNTPWFSVPVADELRSILLRAIAFAANAIGAPLTMIDAWPNGVEAVGLISHDSDLNVDEHAHTTLRLLETAGIKSTWCHMWGPRYDDAYQPSTFRKIAEAGHEIALHYNALDRDGGSWGQKHLKAQASFVRQESGVGRFTSNKNHYTRWEGSSEFFHWLAEEGIEVDQSRGPSKKGNVGYTFGTCLPAMAIDSTSGDFINVLELPMQFQDLWLTAPAYQGDTTIRQALRHRGVAHFLYHQIHLHTRPHVAEAFLATIEIGRTSGLEWWRSEDINSWVRFRRGLLDQIRESIDVANRASGKGEVILKLAMPGEAGTIERYGQQWLRYQAN